MGSAWIQTFTGKMFDILDPQSDMVCIEDIAHALSQGNRFTGHCKFPYPVSQHSRLGSYLVSKEFALEFLLHDASEAYIGDMNRPLKHFTTAGVEYRKVEAKIQGLITQVFGLPYVESPIVKKVDNLMLYAEKRQLMFSKQFVYKWSEEEEAADIKIVETSFRQNKSLFLRRFNHLYNK